jgi:hypothetical protein
VGIFVNRYLVNRVEALEPFLGAIRPTDRILWLVLRRYPIKAITGLFSSLRFLRRALQTTRAHNVFWFFIYSASILLPFVTAFLVAMSILYFRKSNPFSDPKISSLYGLGALAPYLVAALREAWKWLTRLWDSAPRFGDAITKKLGRAQGNMARGVNQAIQQFEVSATRRFYAVMGHTHDQDVQRLPNLGGATTLYLNTGTWIPIWSEDRPDLAGRVLFPFVHFRLATSQEYRHEYKEWRDDRGEAAESYILEPPVA